MKSWRKWFWLGVPAAAVLGISGTLTSPNWQFAAFNGVFNLGLVILFIAIAVGPRRWGSPRDGRGGEDGPPRA